MGKKTRPTLPVAGGSFLLVIFAVLCLTVFSLLALSTVRANQRLSDAATRAVAAYYQADCQAEEILARLRGGEIPDGVTRRGQVYLYDCPISDAQTLRVEVQLDGAEYAVLRWQAISTAEWDPDDTVTVWDGANKE